MSSVSQSASFPRMCQASTDRDDWLLVFRMPPSVPLANASSS